MKALRFVISLFMAVIMPVLNFFSSLGKPPKPGNFNEPEKVIKSERVPDEFICGDNDIILRDGIGFEQAIEQIKTMNGENVTVWLHEGTYNLTKPTELNGISNVSFRACPNEKVYLTACREIGGWTETTVNGVKAWVTDCDENAKFNTLFKDDIKLSVSRYPKSGYLLVKDRDADAALFTKETSPWEYTYGDTAFFTNNDLKFAELYNTEDVQIKLMHYWFCEKTTLTSYRNGRISVKAPCSMRIQPNDRYFLENVFEALSEPGEWYHDSEKNKIYYIPQDGDDINTIVLTAPTENLLFDISDCQNITFSGITIKNTDWCYSEPDPSVGWLGEHGLLFPQGNLECAGVFDITRSDNINFKNCDFLNIGNGAIRFNRICKSCDVTGCTFREIGSNAVFINGYNTHEVDKQTSNINIIDNLIEGYGRNFPSAIGILLTHALNCKLSHNEIHDGYYTAISCGWIWGYGENVTDNIEVSENLIYDIGQGWLSDMGGIYMLGIQPHTIITHNTIHDVAADPNEGGYGGWGIYLDEGSSNMTVYQNLSYNCGSNSFHQHYGRDNMIVNNIFALSTDGEIRITKKEAHNELHLMRNIIVTNNTVAYASTVQNKFTDSKNLYWDLKNGKRVISSSGETLKKFSRRIYKADMRSIGYYNNGIFADPLFRDVESFDFLLADNSPALEQIGFIPWNYNTAGTLTQFN